MQEAFVPGAAAAMVQDGHIVEAPGYGVRCVRTLEPVDEHTISEAASLPCQRDAAAVQFL